jgi:hypothetical protein
MDDKLLKQLLRNGKGELIDFKDTFYDHFDFQVGKISFAMDIIAMANSSLAGDGYIICGVTEHEPEEFEVTGVLASSFVDDTACHQIVAQYSSHPVNFHVSKYRSKIFNALLIVVKVGKVQQRPIICTKDEGGMLAAGAIYYRNGTMNDVERNLATIEQIIAESAAKAGSHRIDSDPTYNRYTKFPTAPYYTFFGRKQEIQDIYEELINHHKKYILALIGDGGIGKTSVAHSLATEILQKRHDGLVAIDDVIWISAKDQRIYEDQRLEINREFKSLHDLYNKILLVFHSPREISGLTLEAKAEKVNQALIGTKFLFVLDNLEVFSPEEISQITDFVSNTPNGHKFLITSRHDIRVNDFIELRGLDDGTFADYCADVMNHFDMEQSSRLEVQASLDGLLKTTNGNPLYLKFFLAQIKKGRSVADIINRRNIEGERGLKQYCFDTTLAQLSHHELLTMHAIASAESEALSLHELVFMTRLDRTELSNITSELIAVSLVDSVYVNDEKCYQMNQFLKSYLKEDRRIPPAEVSMLVGRSRQYYAMLQEIDDQTRLNFYLGSNLPRHKTASFNMTLDVLKNRQRMDAGDVEEKLRDASHLYPGNYLVPFVKYFDKIVTHRKTGYNLYADMNTEFNTLVPDITNAPDLVGMYVWKSLLYICLGKYEDIILDLNCDAVTANELCQGPGQALIQCLKATAYHLQAADAYKTLRYHDHDKFRELAEQLFSGHIDTFMSQPFFFFIKKDIWWSYKTHTHHFRTESLPVRALDPYFDDYSVFRYVTLTALRPLGNI